MSSPEQIRRQIGDVVKKRADEEKRASEARTKQTKKAGEAASYRSKASKSSSESTAKSYLRQADSAEKESFAAGTKADDHGKRAAALTGKEADLSKALSTALAKDRADEERARKRRAEEDDRARKRLEQAERRARERELAAERVRTDALISASEIRLEQRLADVRSPKVERLRILYVTATPEGDLSVDKEIRRVKKGVSAATHRELVEIEPLLAATPSDLLDQMVRFQPHVVHFAGHADGEVLLFDTEATDPNPGQEVAGALFARAMGSVDEPPVLVVLNACESEGHLEGLISVVPMAIGMTDSIGDPDAMSFAARFYTSIADGQSVGGAFATAKVQMEFDGMADANLPVLRCQAGVDPTKVALVIPPEV